MIRLGYPGQVWVKNYGKVHIPWFWGAWGKGEWEHNIWTDESFQTVMYGTGDNLISFGEEFYRLWIKRDVCVKSRIWSDYLDTGKTFIIPIELRFWEENHLECLYYVKFPEQLIDVIHIGQASVVFHNLPEGSASSKFNEAINAFCRNNRLTSDEVYFLNSNLKVHNLQNLFTEIKTDYFGLEPWWNIKDDVDWLNVRKSDCKRFLCLNRRDCVSRIFLTSYIRTSDLLNKNTLWSLGASNAQKNLTGRDALEYIGSDFDKIPESIQVKEFLKNHTDEGICKVLDTDPDIPWISDNRVDLADIYKKAYINVITETIWNQEEHVFLSEKTFKTIYACMPFIIVGTCGTLKALKQFGYKTFNRWWDESYDDEPDAALRMSKVCKLLDTINSWTEDEFKRRYQEMMLTVTYNRNLLLQRIQSKSIYFKVLKIQNRITNKTGLL